MPASDPRRADVDEIRKAGNAALARLETLTSSTPQDDRIK